MPEWTKWSANTGDPYLVWRENTISGEDEARNNGVADFRSLGLESSSQFDFNYKNTRANQGQNDDPKADTRARYEESIDALRARVPESVLNEDPNVKITTIPPDGDLPTLTHRDSVIMGVIDVGIPLGHSRLRNQDGSTRILAAWQQLASNASQYVPFGREMLKPKIDELIAECSGGNLIGWLDEETFNRSTGVVDMEKPFGVREAARFAAHGAHVLDLAAGCDPDDEDEREFAEKVNVIAINMPNVDVVGNSGEFTNGFVLSGIERTLALADAIWHKSFGSDGDDPLKPCPCPVIFNISLGKQAGAKNSVDLFPAYLELIRKRREALVLPQIEEQARRKAEEANEGEKVEAAIELLLDAVEDYASYVSAAASTVYAAKTKAESDIYKTIVAANGKGIGDENVLVEKVIEAARKHVWPPSTLNIVMPVGNDNLGRCNAILEPKSDGEPVVLNWRILPDDQSPNFVEIWASPAKDSPSLLEPDALNKLQVTLTPPDSTKSISNPKSGDIVSWYGKEAAVFRETNTFKKDKDSETTYTLRYVLCVAPTARSNLDQETADAGTWQIKIQNKLGETIQCVCSIQTDQGVLPGSSTSRRSYFDDPDYTVYDSYEGMGNLRESYAYPDAAGNVDSYGRNLNLDLLPSLQNNKVSPVKRHGTMSATAAHKYLARVAGHRLMDGRPAFYSGTGRGRLPGYDRAAKAYNPSPDDGMSVRPESADESRAPTASLPIEDGPMHPGILSAGGANGSVVAMRGTSFAAPQAARVIAQELVKREFPHHSEKYRLSNRARRIEENDGTESHIATAQKTFARIPRPKYIIEALGRGRIEGPVKRRVLRIGSETSRN